MPDYYDEIADLEAQVRKTQYNKATQHHIGMVKAKIAKLREKAEARGKGSGPKTGFEVRKTGDGTVIFLGFPSTGKSTLLNRMCGTESAIAAYAFTTLTVIPGTLEYEHARIQILDVPGIVAGAASGRGRGKEVLATIRSADLCLIVIDAVRPHELDVVRREAASVGVRLNQRKPDVRIKKAARGGVKVATTVRLTRIDAATITDILKEFRITNADVLIREDIDVDQFIDCVEDNKKYMPAIVACNKDDLITAAQRRDIAQRYAPDIFVSPTTRPDERVPEGTRQGTGHERAADRFPQQHDPGDMR